LEYKYISQVCEKFERSRIMAGEFRLEEINTCTYKKTQSTTTGVALRLYGIEGKNIHT
jgi:hypothetical protein